MTKQEWVLHLQGMLKAANKQIEVCESNIKRNQNLINELKKNLVYNEKLLEALLKMD